MSLLTEDRKQATALTAQWNGVGTAPAGSVLTINAPTSSTLGVQLSGTFSATLQFEGLIDEVNGSWFSINASPIPTGSSVSSATAAGQWIIPTAGLRVVRVRCSAFTSGTVNACLIATAGPAPQLGGTTGGGGIATTVNQGTANTVPNAWPIRLADGVGTNLATVSAFHASDNTATGTGFGLLTGGVAQLLNASGNLDRQRETGTDGIPALGIATGTAQFAMAFQTTDSTDNFTAGTRTFTPVAMSGTILGVAWSIQVGSTLILDSGANKETVTVTAVAASTFTCVTTKTHNGTVTPFTITGFVYNQERDAAGELDGASGSGTAIALEYEFNGGAVGTGNFDRNRNLQGKGKQSAAITAGGGTASTSLTLASATGLTQGQQITLSGSGTNEVVYVATNYTPGSTTVPLVTGVVNGTQTTATWSAFSLTGPGSTLFLPDGEGADAEILFAPDAAAPAQYGIARMAPQAATGVNQVGLGFDAIALWAGSNNYVPWQGSAAGAQVQGAAATGAAVAGNPVYVGGKDGSGNAQPLNIAVLGDGLAATPTQQRLTADLLLYDSAAGTASRPLSTKDAAAGTDGHQVPASTACMVVAGSSNYKPIIGNQAGGLYMQGPAGAGAAAAGNPLASGIYDGAHMQFLKGNTDGTLGVGGFTTDLQVSPTISTSAYSAGQNLGGLMAFASAARFTSGSGAIQTITISDKSKQNAAIDLLFFKSAPSTPTDHTTFAPSAADIALCIGMISIGASAYSTFSANSVACVANVGIPFLLSGTSTLNVIAVMRGTPTYASTSDVQITIGIAQD